MNVANASNRLRNLYLSVRPSIPGQPVMSSISNSAENPSRPDERYTTVAIAIHWLAAALIVAALIVGVSMVDVPVSPSRLRLYSYHKWIGITILALSAV